MRPPTVRRSPSGHIAISALAALMASLVLLVGGISVGAPDASTSGRDIAADEPEPVIEGVTHGSRWLVDVRDRSATSLPLSLRPVFATDYAVSPNRRRVAFTAPDPDGAVGATRIFVARRTGLASVR